MQTQGKPGRYRLRTWFINACEIFGLFIIYQVVTGPFFIPTFIKQPTLTVILLSGIMGLFLTAVIAWWCWTIYQKLPAITTAWRRPNHPLRVLVGLAALQLACDGLLTLVLKQTPTNQVDINKSFIANPVFIGLLVVLIAPIIEELIFRGIMYRLFFPKIMTWQLATFSVVLTGCIFAWLHNPAVTLGLVAYLPMALIFSATYVIFKDLRYSLALHSLNNLISVLLMLPLLLK